MTVKSNFPLWYFKMLGDMSDRHSGVHDILVLFRGEAAKRSHQELFALPDAAYRIIKGSIIDEVAAVSPAPAGVLHIAAEWETMLSTAFWCRGNPSVGDVLVLLEKSGMPAGDIASLRDPDMRDIFAMLCRGERPDLLRRICRAAKANVETKFDGDMKVHCHLVSSETGKIVASSL